MARNIQLEEKRLAKSENRMMRGREILWMIYDRYRISEAEGHIYDFQDLSHCGNTGKNLEAFNNDWSEVLDHMKTIPSKDILEALYF